MVPDRFQKTGIEGIIATINNIHFSTLEALKLNGNPLVIDPMAMFLPTLGGGHYTSQNCYLSDIDDLLKELYDGTLQTISEHEIVIESHKVHKSMVVVVPTIETATKTTQFFARTEEEKDTSIDFNPTKLERGNYDFLHLYMPIPYTILPYEEQDIAATN